MQKKLIALAIASAISAPAFADNANFTFYGAVDVSYDMVSTGDGTTTANGATAVTGTSKRVVSSNVSKFGFKGAEDLGGGLAAVWQVEQQINTDDAAKNTFASRNTFAGLKSETLGTVLMGIHDTPYKISTRKLDVFGDNIADNRALLGNKSSAGFELRPKDVLAYISPALGGVTVAVATVNLTEGNTTSTQKTNTALSLAAMYDVAPFYGSVAYEKHALETVAAGANETATRLGFGFSEEMFSVGLVYEKTSDNLGAAQVNSLGHTAYYLGGKFNIGQDAVKFAYGKAGVLGTGAAQVANSGASQVSVGYDLSMSKRTKLYALYTKISNGKGINYGFSQNSGAASTTSGFGTSPSAISLGMKHSF
ncbi:MAG: porin [Nitrosomonadales bacterium]|nr:porin [Nitrosomonadales bacterium]